MDELPFGKFDFRIVKLLSRHPLVGSSSVFSTLTHLRREAQVDEQAFIDAMEEAERLAEVTPWPEHNFWYGYVRGLKRHHNGEPFDTDELHKAWVSAPTSGHDEGMRAVELGYRSGFAGDNIQTAMSIARETAKDILED
jgi:hypothetical protein